MDAVDTKILNYLSEDSRTPYSVIAQKVDLTSTAVGQRVKKMMDAGIILGFGIKVDQEKLGKTIQAIVSLKLNFSKIDPFYKILKGFEEVEYSYRVTGEDCIIMKVNLKDNKHLLSFINQIANYGFSKTNIIIEEIK